MTPARASAYRDIFLVVQALAVVVVVGGSHGGLDFVGRPLGTDFVSFWAASLVALTDGPARVYDVAVHMEAQRAAFDGAALNYTAFFYPPVFLAICLPLALLPYGWALAAWLAATGLLFLAAIGNGVRGQYRALLAFPAIWSNVGHGQNGFLTAALFAGGIRYLDTRPVLAGLLFGGLIYKPHFLAMVPVALLAGGRWRTAFAAIGSATALVALSVAVLGPGAWVGFWGSTAVARAVLEHGMVGDYKMQSLFAAIRLFGGSATLGYVAQALLALTAAVGLAAACRKSPGAPAIGAALAAAALLASPFLLAYDFVLLAIPLLWLWCEARASRFLPWEKCILMLGFALPAVSSATALWLHIPLAAPIAIAIFVSVLRRINSLPPG